MQTAGFVAAVLLLPSLAEATTAYARQAITWSIADGARVAAANAAAVQASLGALLALTLPLLGTAFLLTLGVGFLQTQGNVSAARLAPDLSRLNPISGLGRLFQLDRLFAVARSLLVMLVVGYLAFRLVQSHMAALVDTIGAWPSAWALGARLSQKLLGYAILTSVAVAVLDVIVIRRSWLSRLRMTRDEVKREHKEAEGDPKLRQERKRAHQQMLQGATLNAVKNATVVVVNPTHYATALFYSEEETDAPRVVAQGRDVIARQIIEAARAYGVPVVRDVSVARALDELQIGDEIPEVLYEAVAEILRQVLANPDETD